MNFYNIELGRYENYLYLTEKWYVDDEWKLS